MDAFTASNGVTVETDVHGCITIKGINSLSEESKAVREFCKAEHDEELGRWRWPEDPEIVVYPQSDDESVRVVSEDSGFSRTYSRADVRVTHSGSRSDAARAYFAAHPEPKPWHDAKIGEVWIMVFDSQAVPAIVVEDDGAPWFMVADDIDNPSRFNVVSNAFTEARRVYPGATK